jgi:hypothetical protein
MTTDLIGSWPDDPPAWRGDGRDAERASRNFSHHLELAQESIEAIELASGGYGSAIELADTASTDDLMADLYDGGGYEDYGDGELDGYAETAAYLDVTAELEQQRLAEDAEDAMLAMTGQLRTAEQRLQRGLQRAGTGTYTDPADLWAPPDDTPLTCGQADDLGYCTSETHSPLCSHVIRAAASVGDVAEVDAWNRALNANRSRPAQLDQDLFEAKPQLGTDYHQVAVNLGLTSNPDSPVAARTSAAARVQALQALTQGQPW